MPKYKLIETSKEEHDVLYAAGVWVNWDIRTDSNDVVDEDSYHLSGTAHADELFDSNDLVFFTRVEVDDDVS